MKLEDIGYNEKLEQFRREENLLQFEIGRVIAEHKERYIVKTEMGEFDAEITGNLRYSAQNREDYPAVGDWVALSTFDHDFSIIYKILPRFSTISRQAVGKFGEKQIIATNIDYGLIVQSVNRDFNLNRLERYLTICYSSKIQPIVVITKIDLIDNETLTDLLHKIKTRIDNVPIIALSNETQEGIEELRKLIVKGKTYCLLGSSGVGKSSLINMLCNNNKLAKISATPGKTQLINHFLINEAWYLVDLPGYGYAKTSKDKRTKFATIIYDYCKKRESLVCLFILIDSRLPLQKIDLEFMTWCGENEIAFWIIYTKADKNSKAELARNIAAIEKELLKEWAEMPNTFITSAEKKMGKDDVLDFIGFQFKEHVAFREIKPSSDDEEE